MPDNLEVNCPELLAIKIELENKMNILENDKTEDIKEMVETTSLEIVKHQDQIGICRDFIQECRDELKRRKKI